MTTVCNNICHTIVKDMDENSHRPLATSAKCAKIGMPVIRGNLASSLRDGKEKKAKNQ